MATNTHFYILNYIAKTHKVYNMWYRLQMWCFFVHESLKRDNKKENDEIKRCEITRKNWVSLWDAAVHLKLSVLKNSCQ